MPISLEDRTWSVNQSNGWRATFTTFQDAPTGRVSGSATAAPPGKAGISGSIDGIVSKVSGGSVLIVVNWGNGSRGVYSGNLNLQGKLVGITFDEKNPHSQATWFSDEQF